MDSRPPTARKLERADQDQQLPTELQSLSVKSLLIRYYGSVLWVYVYTKTAKFTPHAQVAKRYIPCARSERARYAQRV